ncbi:8-oxo-dGTP diphosphatase [Exiguobacterium sp. PvP048]|uniref:NUDIX hydrolase n=1 Tax=Exiguobacterium sibiricum (strain DSM 17290 / CCUG 55495 / CIP 109462 / JCM 13490 / 255-15) TaxID=262543 RepID=B1YHX0_EXIS2|nr:NUDIX hydrolase [Exiguobacterium sibiricum]ACB59754.1 NUDIX hydrolase [Exiguobacterium sibiricum 255-15]
MRTLYRIVVGIVRQGDQLLLVKNQADGERAVWSLPGGVIEAGETLADALKREMAEETGLSVETFELAYVTENFIEQFDAHSLVTYFECTIRGELLPNDPDREVVDSQWVPIEQLGDYLLNRDVLEPLQDYLNKASKSYYLYEQMVW